MYTAMSNLTKITLHGVLAEQMGRSEWNLSVKSVGEAVNALECNTKKFFKQLLDNDKKNIKYRVLINDEDFTFEEGKDPNTEEGIMSSELVMTKKNIKNIDIIPVIEGAKDWSAIIVGVFLIASGVGAFGAGGLLGALGGGAMAKTALVLGGIGLVAAGITNLLTEMPKFGDFREIEGGGAKSYLFNGPENTVREGGPVFLGYGRLLVGSHVIQSTSDTVDVDAEVVPKATWGETKHGLRYNIPNNVNPQDWSHTGPHTP